MQLHYSTDLADFLGEREQWLGYLLKVSQAGKARLRVNSAANWHLRVDCDQQALLWASMPERDYQGIYLYRELSDKLALLPPMRASLVHAVAGLSGQARQQHYLRWFAHTLQQQSNLCFRDGDWVLHALKNQPQPSMHRHAAHVHFLSRYKASDWQRAFSEQEREFWNAPYVYVDWGIAGNDSIVPLKSLADPASGRLKWWRKQARLQNLPPILIWRIAALDCYLILDGHLRLQACLYEQIQPEWLVLDSYVCQHFSPDLHRASQIEKQVLQRQQAIADQVDVNPASFAAMQQVLADAYDDRAHRHYVSYARAGMDLAVWHSQVEAFQHRHGPVNWFQLDD